MKILPPTDVTGWSMEINSSHFDALAGAQLFDVTRKTIVVSNCYIVRKDGFWRFFLSIAMQRALRILTFRKEY